jgi:hypothetical protein
MDKFVFSQNLKLRGKSQKGKNRVRELGENWIVLEECDTVLFSSQNGPWLHVQPNAGREKSRWINKLHDADFEIVSC